MARSAGFGAGSLPAALALTAFGTAGLRVGLVVDALSFLLAATVLALTVRPPRPPAVPDHLVTAPAGAVLRNRPFLVLIATVTLLVLVSDVYLVGMPVYALDVTHQASRHQPASASRLVRARRAVRRTATPLSVLLAIVSNASPTPGTQPGVCSLRGGVLAAVGGGGHGDRGRHRGAALAQPPPAGRGDPATASMTCRVECAATCPPHPFGSAAAPCGMLPFPSRTTRVVRRGKANISVRGRPHCRAVGHVGPATRRP
jgi:hypothetical protein